MKTEIFIGVAALTLGLWCVGSAIETCTSANDCLDVLCNTHSVAQCTQYNTCKCQHNANYVPATCTEHKECHKLNCTGDAHRKDCVDGTCKCVDPHLKACSGHHHCGVLTCNNGTHGNCVSGVCTCVVQGHRNHTV